MNRRSPALVNRRPNRPWQGPGNRTGATRPRIHPATERCPVSRYARVSTVEQDLTVQREGLQALGVERIYVDHGLTGANRARPAELFGVARSTIYQALQRNPVVPTETAEM